MSSYHDNHRRKVTSATNGLARRVIENGGRMPIIVAELAASASEELVLRLMHRTTGANTEVIA